MLTTSKIKTASRGDCYFFHVPLLKYFSTRILSTFVSTPLLNTTLCIVPAGVAVPVNPFFNLNLNIPIPPWVRKKTPTKGAFLITFISRYHITSEKRGFQGTVCAFQTERIFSRSFKLSIPNRNIDNSLVALLSSRLTVDSSTP